MEQTLRRVKKLSEYQPVSEKEYLKAIKLALANLIDKYQDGTPMSRKRIAQLINVLRRELKISTDKFIQSFHRDLLNEIWDDYKRGIDSSWFQLDKKGVEHILQFKEVYFNAIKADGKEHHTLVKVMNFLTSIEKKIVKDSYSTITTGYITGVHPSDVAREIMSPYKKNKDIYKTATRNLRTVVKTIFADGQNRVQMQMLKDNQDIFVYYEYISKLDTRTSKICRDTDEERWKTFDEIPKDLYPPLHPNCRSIIVGIVKEDVTINRMEELNKGKTKEDRAFIVY